MTTEAHAASTIQVEVVYALPERYWSVRLQMKRGSTVSEALACAGLERIVENFEMDPARLAIFSRPVQPDSLLRDGDRLEVLRPLSADPKEGRRARAAESAARKR